MSGRRQQPGSGIDRRSVVSWLAWAPLVASGCGRLGERSAAEEETVSEEAVSRWVREYDALGVHRTGTPGDEACARWLAEVLDEVGVAGDLEEIPFERLDPRVCRVEILRDGGDEPEVIEGVPIFDAPPSSAEGVVGRLSSLDEESGGEIGWVAISPSSAGGQTFLEARRSGGYRALVAVTGGERFEMPAGLALTNAESYKEPYGPPAVQLGSEAFPALEQAAREGWRVRVLTDSERVPMVVHNTIATVAGRDPSLAPLLVMTPRSGWWQCASERGGGIAVWIEIARALAAARPVRSTHLVASTGHELGHYGLDHYIEARSELLHDAAAWVHLGANFAAAVGPGVLLQVSDEPLHRQALDALAARGLAPDMETPIGQRPLGEARNVFDGGGRYISILGQNGLFHHPSDRWPEAVDVPRLAGFAAAFVELALALADGATKDH